MTTATDSRTSVDGWGLTAVLALGDGLAILAFVLLGLSRHYNSPVPTVGIVVTAVAPFLLAWGATAGVAGLFKRDAVSSVRRTLLLTVPAWGLAVAIGHALRASSLFRGSTSLGFVVVTLVIGGAFLVGWRLLVSVVVE